MELIPILSLIILVATISTFILAVGAYILYKIRERKGRVAQAPQPAAIPAELVTPAPLVAEQKVDQSAGRRTFTEETHVTRFTGTDYQRQPLYMTGQEEVKQSGPEMRPTYVNPPTSETRYEKPKPSVTEAEPYSKRKFMRYTKEGYIDPAREEKKKEEKKSKEDTLRWR
ncbi:MAG: hypothetical protein PVH88_09815 [Ignavibacteria bacterium]|jgi:hypothetical protein